MMLLSPLWLLGLLPWMAVLIWLLRRRRRPTGVPFLDLWRGPARPPKPTRNLDPPPWPLAMVLLAMLLAIVAAAKPGIEAPARGTPVTLIVDRGAAMSAGAPRYLAAARMLQQELTRLEVGRPVNLLLIPGGEIQRLGPTEWLSAIEAAKPTAVQTGPLLAATVARHLAETTGPVVVLSDQDIGINDPRLIQVPPGAAVSNFGIARLMARASPRPQVMVTAGGDRPAGTQVPITITSAGVSMEFVLRPFPPEGQTRDYFIDVPVLGATVEAALGVQDDAGADDRAWLVREGSWPRIEPRVPLPPPLQRMVQTYAKARPPSADAPPIAIANETLDLPTDLPAVVLASDLAPGAQEGGEFVLASHPVMRNVTIDELTAQQLQIAANPPGEGWQPLLEHGGRVLAAVRENGAARRVWVGFDSPAWVRSTGFVIFWANVFDWLNEAEPRYTSAAVGTLDPQWTLVANNAPGESPWWPGVYRGPDGALRAMNSGMIQSGPVLETDWRQRLAHLPGAGRLPLETPLVLTALALTLLAATTWQGRRFDRG